MQVDLPSPEFALVVDCCRAGFRAAEGECLPAIPPGISWPKVIRLSGRHRVEGLVNRALDRRPGVPAAAEEELRTHGRLIAARALQSAMEMKKIDEALRQAGIVPLFLKGLALGREVYADPFSKSAIDIDLLVRTNELEEAARVLESLAYFPAAPTRAERVRQWHRVSKESQWCAPGGQIVDLHDRLSDLPATFNTAKLDGYTKEVEIGPEIGVSTLTGAGLVTYLAVHGASSGWFRLKWLADFAGLVALELPAELDRIAAECRRLTPAPIVDLAFTLAHQLFATPLPANTRRVAVPLTLAKSLLYAEREPTETLAGTVPLHLLSVLLEPTMRRRGQELRRQLLHSLQERGLLRV